jgi:lipoprotein NlpI
MFDFTKAIVVNPRYADAFNNRGVILARKGNYDKAIDDFTKALEIDSFYADAYYNRGVTWFDKGNLQQALADIEKALNLKPEDQRNKKAGALVEIGIKNFKIE